jgi:toxin CcdB
LRQFDVYANPSARSREMSAFVVVLQSHLLEAMPTVVIAPMLSFNGAPGYSRTSAMVRARTYLVSAAELAAIEKRRLTRSLGSPAEFEDEIRRALNLVCVGV